MKFFLVLIVITFLFIIIAGLQNLYYSLMRLRIGLLRRTYRKKREVLSLEKLSHMDEKLLAVYVGAWQEDEIIEQMLEQIVLNQKYENYRIFVGTYPNDLKTQEAVDRISQAYPLIVKVVADRPGPTTKSHNLNNVYEAMLQYEKQEGVYFEGIIIHDAEDGVNPYELSVFNYFSLRMDAIQFPILPMPVAHRHWIHWVYADEFAVYQYRDSVVREFSSGFVAFAGVGMALPRRTVNQLMKMEGQSLFPEDSLTEDYLMSAKLAKSGIAIRYLSVHLKDEKVKWYTPYAKRDTYVANWSYFPMTYKRSLNQKVRWLKGIVFQSPKRIGWSKKVRLNETFLKDRRIYFDYFFFMIALGLLIYNLILAYGLYPVVNIYALYPWLLFLYRLTLIFVIEFLVSRWFCVFKIYGLVPSLLSFPRLLFSMVFNVHLTFKAFISHYYSKEKHWDKTQHTEGVASVGKAKTKEGKVEKKGSPVVLLDLYDLLENYEVAQVQNLKRRLHQYGLEIEQGDEKYFLKMIKEMAQSGRYELRAFVPTLIKYKGCEQKYAHILIQLLQDHQWIVRHNSGNVLVRHYKLGPKRMKKIYKEDPYSEELVQKILLDGQGH